MSNRKRDRERSASPPKAPNIVRRTNSICSFPTPIIMSCINIFSLRFEFSFPNTQSKQDKKRKKKKWAAHEAARFSQCEFLMKIFIAAEKKRQIFDIKTKPET